MWGHAPMDKVAMLSHIPSLEEVPSRRLKQQGIGKLQLRMHPVVVTTARRARSHIC
jgi:hypothetical protein